MPKCIGKTTYIPATVAWSVLLCTTAAFFVFPCKFYLWNYPWVPAYQGVITLFVLAFFTLATFMDPGIIPQAPPDEDREDDLRAPLYKNADIHGITVRMKWCMTCKFYRPPRCSHCSVCNHCIETFDHHCPWVNNCIGRRNYRFFFAFLLSLSAHMVSIFSLCLIFVLNHNHNLAEVDNIVSLIIMGLIILLFIPVIGLTLFHTFLVLRGRTTNEQVTGKFKGGYNPFSRGYSSNCFYTLCGPQFPSLLKASKRGEKRRKAAEANMNQVKTYTDNGNGLSGSPSHNSYNKLSPGRECSDTDMEPSASQSKDCEPTPPLVRPGSKNNLYMGGMDDSPRYPAPPIRTARSHTPDPLPASQRVRAIGIPTPLVMSSPIRRSNPGTPTQPRRPDFIGVAPPRPYYDPPPPHPYSSPQRRFLSEGELVRQAPMEMCRPNNTVDNIRELAGSPQKSVYTFKDNSPGARPDLYRSNPTSPNQPMYMARPAGVFPPRGGVQVFPPQSPQVKKKATPTTPTSDPRRRPMSFARALEMSDSIEMPAGPPRGGGGGGASAADRGSVYDMNYEGNYEISV